MNEGTGVAVSGWGNLTGLGVHLMIVLSLTVLNGRLLRLVVVSLTFRLLLMLVILLTVLLLLVVMLLLVMYRLRMVRLVVICWCWFAVTSVPLQ